MIDMESDDDMEAGFDEIQREEEQTRRIAVEEDIRQEQINKLISKKK